MELASSWGLALYSSRVALLLLLHSLVGKGEKRIGMLYVISGCFVEDFGCSMERISSGQMVGLGALT